VIDLRVARWRLHAQHLSRQVFADPAEVVRWMGAVQAQDYRAALLGVGLRTRGGAQVDVAAALRDRTIVRTHFMRNTVHLLPAEDLRWMLRLMAPRIRRLIDNVARANGVAVDEAMYAQSNEVIAAELAGARQRSRPELAVALERAGIGADAGRLTMLTQRAQVDGVVCHGLRRGAHHGLVLVDEWLPPGRSLDRDEALAEFALRYVRSHGPATAHDYAWWSGMTLADARSGLEAARPRLHREQSYWFAEPPPPSPPRQDVAVLLANYDEYLVGYKDRSAVFDAVYRPMVEAPTHNPLFAHTIVVNGEIVGTWRRPAGDAVKRGTAVTLHARLFRALRPGEAHAFAAAGEQYGALVGCPVKLSTTVG